jgi:hypothetical protein
VAIAVGIEPELGVEAVGKNPSNAARSGKELEGETRDRRGEGGEGAEKQKKILFSLLLWCSGALLVDLDWTDFGDWLADI